MTYQDSCHLANAQRITDAPRAILNSIPGVELVEMERSDVCCGAGGTYTITEREFSLRVLDSKMQERGQDGGRRTGDGEPGLCAPTAVRRSEVRPASRGKIRDRPPR